MAQKKIKTLEALNDFIEASNEKFNAMTDAQKRVVIARDCIERIQLKQIVAASGNVVKTNPLSKYGTGSIKEMINKQTVACEACAKGGLFLSYVGRVNQFDLADFEGGNCSTDSTHMKLLEIFSLEQLAMIEFAFEGKPYLASSLPSDEYSKIREFFKKHGGSYEQYSSGAEDFYAPENDTDEDVRLIAICKNIIKNKGTFKL